MTIRKRKKTVPLSLIPSSKPSKELINLVRLEQKLKAIKKAENEELKKIKTEKKSKKKSKPKKAKTQNTKPRKIETFTDISEENNKNRPKVNDKLQKLIDKGINPYEKAFSNPDSLSNILKNFSYRMGV